MNNKKILSGLVLASATLCLVAPTTVNAATSGTSDATVSIKKDPTPPGETGALTFSEDVSTTAKINFADTTLNGALQTADEKTPGAAKIKISDTRENIASSKTGYTVTVEDVTEKTGVDPSSILKNNMSLKFASVDVTGSHTHHNVTLSATADTLLTGAYDPAVKNKEVSLKPTLTIPATLVTAGTYNAKIQWTLAPEV